MSRYGLHDPACDGRRTSRGENSDAWAWAFLRLALSTLIGYDDADGIVTLVQASMAVRP